MSFNILDNLDKLTILKTYPTWIEAVCPVCEGKLTISIGYKNGAYACWTNECHKKGGNLVRHKLYNRYNPFNRSNVFETHKPSKSLVSVVKSIGLDESCTAESFLSPIEFIRPKMIREPEVKKLTTYFDYEEFTIVRLDYTDVDSTKKKYIYPMHIDNEGNEVKELPSNLTKLPIYKLEYIQPNIVIVEGEKCATIGQFLGIACITFSSLLQSERYLDRCIAQLYELGVRNVMYLRDNDIVGLRKAKFISNLCSKNKIGNKIVNVAEIYDKSDKDKYDLYDLYKDKSLKKKDSLSLLSDCISS